MEKLHEAHCIPCKGGLLPADENEIARYLVQLPDWHVVEVDGVRRLTRSFAFDNFAHALAFTDRVGALAETEGHHPVLLTEWGKVTVTWWTHAIGGLHTNDFIMASRTEGKFQTMPGAK